MSSASVLVAAETEQDLQVELVRMCIAEAGYDPGVVQPHPSPATGFTFVIVGGLVPAIVCWRKHCCLEQASASQGRSRRSAQDWPGWVPIHRSSRAR